MTEEMRSHIIIGAGPPTTEAGRLWHEEWHSGAYHEAPTECGSAGCGFLGRILAVEAEARADVQDACQAAGLPRDAALHVLLDTIERRGTIAALNRVRLKVMKALTITAPSDLSVESIFRREAYDECLNVVLRIVDQEIAQ